jgi:hypothetical protein
MEYNVFTYYYNEIIPDKYNSYSHIQTVKKIYINPNKEFFNFINSYVANDLIKIIIEYLTEISSYNLTGIFNLSNPILITKNHNTCFFYNDHDDYIFIIYMVNNISSFKKMPKKFYSVTELYKLILEDSFKNLDVNNEETLYDLVHVFDYTKNKLIKKDSN